MSRSDISSRDCSLVRLMLDETMPQTRLRTFRSESRAQAIAQLEPGVLGSLFACQIWECRIPSQTTAALFASLLETRPSAALVHSTRRALALTQIQALPLDPSIRIGFQGDTFRSP